MTRASSSRQQRRATVTIFQPQVGAYRRIAAFYQIPRHDVSAVFNTCLAVVAAALRDEDKKQAALTPATETAKVVESSVETTEHKEVVDGSLQPS